MNNEFWVNHDKHRAYLIEHDKPWFDYDKEATFIISAIYHLA